MWSLFYQLFLYTLAIISDADPTEVTAEATAEILVEVTDVPINVTAEIPTDVTAEMLGLVTADDPTNVTAETSAEVTADELTNMTAEMSFQVPTNVTAKILVEVTADVPINVTAEMPTDATVEILGQITADDPTNVTSEIPAEVAAELPTNVAAEMSVEVPTNVIAEISVEVPTNVRTEMSVKVPTNVTAEIPVTVEVTDLADERITPNIIDVLSQGFQKEIQAIKQPIDEAIINIGSITCEHVKKLFGISYEQMKEEIIPDLNKLTLVYKSEYSTMTMNISAAPAALAHERRPRHDQRLIMFLHGFTDDPSKEVFDNLTRSFFVKKHTSVLALDASPLIRWLYYRSTSYVRFIGHKLALALAAICQNGQAPAHIHLIGNSLGGHIAGWAGKAFRAITGAPLGRISGLDPAGPCFSHLDPALRLSRTDATYVDVTHTDAGVFGIKDAVGHKDYYPNSGSMQPNCMLQVCSHTRSWLVYGESVVNPLAFPAVRCRDWDAFKNGECESEISYMGYPSKPEGSSGLYFLQTGGTYPYGLGLEGVKYRNADGLVQSIGNFFG